MKENKRMKWLKIAGWVLIPYIMILFTFKRLHGAKRIAGIAWAAVALIIAIASQSTPPANETTATVDTKETVASAEEAVETEATTAVETVVPVEEDAAVEQTASIPTVSNEVLDKQLVLDYTANIRGQMFVKDVQVGDHDISVSYHTNFNEYQTENPESGVTESDYLDYFGTDDQINKILMEESARLLKEFPAANEIKISLPFEGKTYSVDLQEDAAETFFDVDFDTLKASDPTGGNAEWRAQVSDKYFNATDRQRFVDEFVTVQ